MVAESHSLPKTNRRGFAPRFDTGTRLRVRSMYVVEGLQAKEIAKKTGLTHAAIHQLVSREGWRDLRLSNQKRMEERADAKAISDIDSIVETFAVKAEEMGIRSLFEAGDILDAKPRSQFWAKDLQSVSNAARNFVAIARQARGLDANASDAGKVTVVFSGMQRIGPEDTKSDSPTNVTEIQDTSVTEIQVQPVLEAPETAAPIVLE